MLQDHTSPPMFLVTESPSAFFPTGISTESNSLCSQVEIVLPGIRWTRGESLQPSASSCANAKVTLSDNESPSSSAQYLMRWNSPGVWRNGKSHSIQHFRGDATGLLKGMARVGIGWLRPEPLGLLRSM